jgi:hypothetical protein
MQILTRREAEQLFRQMDVVSSRLEPIGKGLRINLTFSNRNSLLLEYNVGRQGKVFGFKESEGGMT